VDGTVTLTANGSRVLSVPSLAIGASGRFDIGDNALVINYNGASPIATIAANLLSGYAGGAWNGLGIDSSAVLSNPDRAVGLAEATDVFANPQSFLNVQIDSTTLLLRLTIAGDATLDRKVDTDDLLRLANNYNQGLRRWSQGDFTFDQTTDTADLAVLARNWQATLSIPAPPLELPASLGGPVRRTPTRAVNLVS
jgi:hypothetical protein